MARSASSSVSQAASASLDAVRIRWRESFLRVRGET